MCGRGPILLSWGSPWSGAGCYELAGLVKSSTPVMVALQKKQSLLFIRCWLMQALGQRRKEHELPPAPVALVGVAHTSYSLARFVGAGPEDGRDGVCVADGAQVFLAGGLWGGVGGYQAVSGGSKNPMSQDSCAGSWGCCRARGPGWGGELTRVVAAACLDSSLRWFSILSTFASSSALMYSVSVGESHICVGGM